MFHLFSFKVVIAIVAGGGSGNSSNSGLSQAMGGPQVCLNVVASVLPTLLMGLPLISDHEEDEPGKKKNDLVLLLSSSSSFFFSLLFPNILTRNPSLVFAFQSMFNVWVVYCKCNQRCPWC